MPTYTYHCKSCDHEWEEVLSIANMRTPLDEPCVSCNKPGELEMIMGAPKICDPARLGLLKPRSDFTERMREIKKSIPKNSLPDY